MALHKGLPFVLVTWMEQEEPQGVIESLIPVAPDCMDGMNPILTPEQAAEARADLSDLYEDIAEDEPLYTDSDSGLSTAPGDVWVIESLMTSLDPWPASYLDRVRALKLGERGEFEFDGDYVSVIRVA